MSNFIEYFELKKEANLLDSKLYIAKAFFAVATAYFISSRNPILKLDIISVLFGLMLTLEPVTLTGVKNGFNQIYATVLGAISTVAIVYFFGNSMITIALSVSFTLYICLKIDWRAVSPVAIFTAIYMTQYVQKTAQGVPSMLLTFRLRMFALGTGIFIAILFNLLFSNFAYRSMVTKRISFLLEAVLYNLKQSTLGIKEKEKKHILTGNGNIPQTFTNIDWVLSLFNDMKAEYIVKPLIGGLMKSDMEKIENTILFMRNITHLNYDLNYLLVHGNFETEEMENNRERITDALETYTVRLEKTKKQFDKNHSTIQKEDDKDSFETRESLNYATEKPYNRLLQDLKEIEGNIELIEKEVENIEYFNKKIKTP